MYVIYQCEIKMILRKLMQKNIIISYCYKLKALTLLFVFIKRERELKRNNLINNASPKKHRKYNENHQNLKL